jgi:hypothetical protein
MVIDRSSEKQQIEGVRPRIFMIELLLFLFGDHLSTV